MYFGAASVTLQLLTFSGKAGRFPWSVSLFQYRLMRKLAMDFTLPVMLISVGWGGLRLENTNLLQTENAFPYFLSPHDFQISQPRPPVQRGSVDPLPACVFQVRKELTSPDDRHWPPLL